MQINAIKNLVNSRLAGEQLTYSQLLPYLNAVVDDINARLHTQFLVFSEITSTDASMDYSEFPDRYIRTVVCTGAAYKWYTDDEEGIATAEALGQEYQNNLFLMERDYGPLIPTDKRRNDRGGFFTDPSLACDPTQNFWNPDIRYLEKTGFKGTSITALTIQEKDGARHLIATLTDQEFGSTKVDCGIISPNVIAFQVDVKGDIVALMSDGTVYKVGGNLKELVERQILRYNPIVSLTYNGEYFIATAIDGSKTIVGEHYSPSDASHIFTTTTAPTTARNGDIWIKTEDV